MSQIENELETSRLLRDWYRIHKRELPWRESSDPYIIWISEIILQQTRVVHLEFSLKKKNTSVQAQLEELLKCLYESEVPEPVREYLDSRAAPAARPRRPARPAKPQTREEPPSALAQPTDERNGE